MTAEGDSMTKQNRIDMDTAVEMMDEFEWDTIVHYMDDDIRESLHTQVDGSDSKEVFLAKYIAEHRSTFGQEFVIN
jgi:hypothetical protein